ncbi:MAG TPA: SulP family inorganic anion transporter [Methylomirabilota bacterium]|nr:SulP family inorganic anion transporter [Methylomirabilota bacterium]
MVSRSGGALGGDLAGGVTAATLTIPVSMGFGALAVHGLGEGYLAYGILASLYSAAVVPIVAVLLGASTTTIYAPRSVVASLIGSIVVQSLLQSGTIRVDLGNVPQTLSLLMFVIFMTGLFQALCGGLRLGSLVRYIPSPVMAGFQNAAALLILMSQLDPMLGVRQHLPLTAVLARLAAVQPLTLAIGILTVLAMWHGPRLIPRLPAPLLGLAVGTGAYYLAVQAGLDSALGPTLGTLPPVLGTSWYLPNLVALVTDSSQWHAALALIPVAASLAVVASFDALLCVKTAESVTGQRASGNRELLRLGLGNTVAACLGGIASGVSLSATAANHRAGARTSRSGLISGVTVLLGLLFLAPLLGFLPRVVIAGMLTVLGLQLFDRWSLELVRRLLRRQLAGWHRMTLDLGVIVLVATLAIAVDLFIAVAVGIVVAVVFFLFNMSRGIVRRTYHGDAVHSRKTREPRVMEILQAHGRQILVLELEGPIFFGTAADLATRVEAARTHIAYLVLDLKRVNEIDTTGARILLQMQQELARHHTTLLLSHMPDRPGVRSMLDDMGVLAALTRNKVFADTDRALEWAEDQLIVQALGASKLEDEYSLEHLDLLTEFTKAEREVLAARLTRWEYVRGAVVFREGDKGRELFIIARGTASVKLRLAGGERERRLATFAAGTVFGELALLDAGPRSASVEADEDLVCYVLSETDFAALVREHHDVAIKLLASLARELSARLRRATRTIYELEA